jgi:hypothetical protein
MNFDSDTLHQELNECWHSLERLYRHGCTAAVKGGGELMRSFGG